MPDRDSKADRRRKELAAAALLLLLEKRARRLVWAAAAVAMARADRSNAQPGDAEALIGLAVMSAVAHARKAARDGARRAWASMTSVRASTAAQSALQDVHAAHSAGHAIGRAWGQSSASEATAAETRDTVRARAERTATTEVVRAWNDETTQQNDRLYAEGGYEIVETWESALDKGTCDECAEMAGKSVTRPERFPEEPPLHPNCRCIITTDVVQSGRRAA